jgi:hypothetical protein
LAESGKAQIQADIRNLSAGVYRLRYFADGKGYLLPFVKN